MDDDNPAEKPDPTLARMAREPLDRLSIGDLEARIDNLRAEIARCEAAIADRKGALGAAERLFRR